MSNAGAATQDAAGFTPGSVVLGKYRIEAYLGQGGMGVVALATHLKLNERVAIKFLRGEAITNERAQLRFLREAQAVAKLRSEHAVRVSDVGVLDNGMPYMVMEFLHGEDLQRRLRTSGPIGAALAADFVVQVCSALAEAHALGIVHRDLKPSNFFVTERADGTSLVKVLDFGISKAPDTGELALTSTQSLLGTPAYMSPEQMRTPRLVDGRSDIWSLGAVIYELVQGQRPFVAPTYSDLCLRVVLDPPAPITAELPPGFAHIILRCLEKDPARRFQNVGELAAALAPHAHNPRDAGILAERIQRTLERAGTFQAPFHRPSGSDALPPIALAPTTPLTPPEIVRVYDATSSAAETPVPDVQPPRSRRRPAVIALSAAVAITVAGIAIAMLARDGSPEAPRDPAQPHVVPAITPPAVPVDAAIVPSPAIPDAGPAAGPQTTTPPVVVAPPTDTERSSSTRRGRPPRGPRGRGVVPSERTPPPKVEPPPPQEDIYDRRK